MPETYPMAMPERPPYSAQPAAGSDGRFIVIDRDYRMVSITPLTKLEHAKDLAEALSAAHERRKAREAGE